MPEYKEAIAPIVIVAIGAGIYSFLTGYASALGILGRGRNLLVIQGAYTALIVPAVLVLSAVGLGLEGVALATSSALVALGISTMWYFKRASREPAR